MKHQDCASSVSRSFSLSSDFPSVACFRCRMPYERMVGRGKIFGQNTLRRRKICLKRLCRLTLPLPSSHALPLHPSIGNMRLVGWTQLYHRLVPLPQETNNEILPALSLPITNCLNSILSLLHILNAMAITISRLYSS